MMKNNWIGEIPKDFSEYVGFVYVIKEESTNKIYIGIKKFWKKITLKPLKGRKNKRHKLVISDWETYKTSSKIMQEKLKKNPEDYTFYIYKLCKSVTEMKAIEAYEVLHHYVNGKMNNLYNQMVNLRLRIR